MRKHTHAQSRKTSHSQPCHVNIAGLMESMSEELRVSTKGKSLVKFTTIYPYMVDTGLCKKPKIK